MRNNTEKLIINRAMKDFRRTQAHARNEGVEINSIFYTGERLTPIQIDLIKEAIYTLSELNEQMGKENADNVIKSILSDVMAEMFLENLMR